MLNFPTRPHLTSQLHRIYHKIILFCSYYLTCLLGVNDDTKEGKDPRIIYRRVSGGTQLTNETKGARNEIKSRLRLRE